MILSTTSFSEEQKFSEFDEEIWKENTKGVEYDGFSEKKETQKRDLPNFNFPTFSSTVAKVIFIIIACAVLIFFAYILIKNAKPDSAEISRNIIYKKIDEADDIDELDLNSFLEEALKMNDFRLAVRVKYLILLKDLNLRKYIKWSKEKTNGEYVLELISHPIYFDFQNITLEFERSWYGEKEVEKEQYNFISESFNQVNSKLNTQDGQL